MVHQLARHSVRYRPAHDPATEQFQDCRQIEQSLLRLDVDDICQPILVRPLGAEIPVQSVGRRPVSLVALGRGPAPPDLFGTQTVCTHQMRRPILAAHQLQLPHDLVDARTAVGFPTPLKLGLDLGCQSSIRHLSLAGRPPTPGIVPVRRHLQHLAHEFHRKPAPVVLNELKLHLHGREKMAIAFLGCRAPGGQSPARALTAGAAPGLVANRLTR